MRRSLGVRFGLALLPLLIVFVAAWATGVAIDLDATAVRNFVAPHGPWALPLFVFLYGLGVLAYIPGSVFVGAGVLAFGPVTGGLASYVGATWGNLLSFGLVRLTGFRPKPVKPGFLQRTLDQVESRPTTAVLIVRVIFPSTAWVNYALALTPVPTRSFVLGSMTGVLPQLVATILVFVAAFNASS